MAFRLFGCPAEGRHDAIDAPASVAEFNALGQAALTRCAGAWGGEFLVDAQDSLLAQAAPDMASRLIIGHILLESCLCIWAHATVSRVAIIARSSAVTSRSFTAKGRQRAFGTSKVVGPCPGT